MQVLPIDLTGLIASFMGILLVMIPVAGLTLRFALKPVMESVARWAELRSSREDVEILTRRVALLEQQIENLEGTVHRLTETADFDRQLAAGESAPGSISAPRSPAR